MLKEVNKWLKDTIRPYKHENQKNRDQRQLIDGIVNLVVGTIKLGFKLINLMLIVPIKALIADWKDFTAKYKEIGEGDITKIIPTFKQAVTGFVQLLTAPIIPFRILFRWFLTPTDGVSVFTNQGLKTVVNEYSNTHKLPDTAGVVGAQQLPSEDLPKALSEKIAKYSINKQKDSSELKEILQRPISNYYKLMIVRDRIADENAKKEQNIIQRQAGSRSSY